MIKKSNVIIPKPERNIGSMTKGEWGFCVPWAYDCCAMHIDKDYSFGWEKHGTATLFIVCVEPGLYKVDRWGDPSLWQLMQWGWHCVKSFVCEAVVSVICNRKADLTSMV